MPNIKTLTNSNFNVLSYFYDNRDKNNLIRTTQNEVGLELNMNRSTINYIIKALKSDGYIIHDESRVGRYYLTDMGIKVVEKLREVDKL